MRKSALLALYLADVLRLSAPCITTRPSAVQTLHFHRRPRFFNTASKRGRCGGILIPHSLMNE